MNNVFSHASIILVQTKISHLLVATFMVPWGWIWVTLVMPWLFLHQQVKDFHLWYISTSTPSNGSKFGQTFVVSRQLNWISIISKGLGLHTKDYFHYPLQITFSGIHHLVYETSNCSEKYPSHLPRVMILNSLFYTTHSPKPKTFLFIVMYDKNK